MTEDDLKFRQAAAMKVEQSLKQVIIELDGAQNLKVCDVQFIAQRASRLAFDAFTKPE